MNDIIEKYLGETMVVPEGEGQPVFKAFGGRLYGSALAVIAANSKSEAMGLTKKNTTS